MDPTQKQIVKMSLARTTTLRGVNLNWTFTHPGSIVDVFTILENHLLKQSATLRTHGSAVTYQIRVDNNRQVDWLRWKSDGPTAPQKKVGGQSAPWNQVPSRFIDPARAIASKPNAGKSVPPPYQKTPAAAAQGPSTATHSAGPSQQGKAHQGRSPPVGAAQRQSSVERNTSIFCKYPQPPPLGSHRRPWFGYDERTQGFDRHGDSRSGFASWHPVSQEATCAHALVCLLIFRARRSSSALSKIH